VNCTIVIKVIDFTVGLGPFSTRVDLSIDNNFIEKPIKLNIFLCIIICGWLYKFVQIIQKMSVLVLNTFSKLRMPARFTFINCSKIIVTFRKFHVSTIIFLRVALKTKIKYFKNWSFCKILSFFLIFRLILLTILKTIGNFLLLTFELL